MSQELYKFQDAMAKGGAPFDSTPIADGEIHRFHIEGHKRGSVNGWYVLYPGDFYAGTFGNWKDGSAINWCSKNRADMSQTEQAEHRRHIKQAQKERHIKKQAEQEAAAQKAAFIWRASQAVTSHPYLNKKGVLAHRIRQYRGSLVLPLRNKKGHLRSLQFITDTGKKRFLGGGEIVGNYHVLHTQKAIEKKQAFICEGYATGATLHEATGAVVFIAFNSGNLNPMALNVWAKYMDWQLIIAADNDHKNETQGKRNAGLEEGRKAAINIGASLVYPSFPNDIDGSDFNDLAGIEPLTEVLAMIQNPQQETRVCQ